MAYEDQTYDVILERMIARVEESYPDLDTREGSIIYNALAAGAMEGALYFAELDNTRDQSFVATASRDYIFRACEQMGMDTDKFEATRAVFKGEFNVRVPIGSRWNYDIYNFVVDEELESDGDYFAYKMTCETEGSEVNYLMGTLSPITDSPDNLIHAELVECLVTGEDELTDDEVREEYFKRVSSTVSDGNIAQYERWCEEYPGIGHYRIFPLRKNASGGVNATVTIVILDGDNRKPSGTLVSAFQNYLDPGGKGMGNGVAPIGAKVTVEYGLEEPIDISFKATLKDGVEAPPSVDDVLTEYFKEIAFKKDVVSYMSIGAVILSIDGIESISDLKLNDGTSDIKISSNSYYTPVLGTLDWTVV